MASRRCGYLTVTTDVDLDEALEAISDERLVEEVKKRKLNLGRDDINVEDDLRDAYAELLAHRPAEVMAILDRLLRPKWSSPAACETALRTLRHNAMPGS
jgi:hypothetical protein